LLRGTALIEYGLLIALIAVLVLGGVLSFGPTLGEWFARIVRTITATLTVTHSFTWPAGIFFKRIA
jgi:Flp pilus assembly pilin Flp